MFDDLDLPLNASRGLSASAKFVVQPDVLVAEIMLQSSAVVIMDKRATIRLNLKLFLLNISHDRQLTDINVWYAILEFNVPLDTL